MGLLTPYVQDLASTNGTKLKKESHEERLRPHGEGADLRQYSEPKKLELGDKVILGLTTLCLRDGPAVHPDPVHPSICLLFSSFSFIYFHFLLPNPTLTDVCRGTNRTGAKLLQLRATMRTERRVPLLHSLARRRGVVSGLRMWWKQVGLGFGWFPSQLSRLGVSTFPPGGGALCNTCAFQASK
jgi:hypothetical protein